MSRLFRQSSQLARHFRLVHQPSFSRRLPVHITSQSILSRACNSPCGSRPRCFSSGAPPPGDDSKPEADSKKKAGSKKRARSKKMADVEAEEVKPKPAGNFKPGQPSVSKTQESRPGEHENQSEQITETGDNSGPPLPEGWIRLNQKEIHMIMRDIPYGKLFTTEFPSFELQAKMMRSVGAPPQTRELLVKMEKRSIAPDELNELIDCIDAIRKRVQMVEAIRDNTAKGKHEDEDKAADHPGNQESTGKDGRESSGGDSSQGQENQRNRRPGDIFEQWKRLTFDVVQSAVLLIFSIWIMDSMSRPFTEKELTWQEFRTTFLDKGLVQKLMVVDGSKVQVELRPDAIETLGGGHTSSKTYTFSIGSVESFERKLEKAQDQLGIPLSERIPVSYEAGSGTLGNIIMAFGPTLLFIGLIIWSQRSMSMRGGGGGVFNFGKSKAKKFNAESSVRVKFADVAGLEEAKTEIMEFVNFLKRPEKFLKLGAKIPRGAILSGPPGTGKTLLAKATAGESGVPFYSVSGSEFVEMFVGVGPSRVRDLFAEGRKNAPCIIFIDEIDAIGRSRSGNNRFGGNDEREATLNQILTEMDGFNTQEQVVVLAGTNRADILDGALMRPGRFDRHIVIDRPTMKGRKEIFMVYLKKIVTKEDIENLVGRLAAMTPGFSGADISNVVNEAALIAARNDADDVKIEHFEHAIDRVVGGLERKSLVLRPQEKKTVAYHEAGHAICGWFLKDADPLVKVSIIPRGQGALGYAQYLPQDAYLMNVDQLMDRMAMTMGGRVSEELHFPTVTTGASDDFKKVTQMARSMVTQWGMSDKVGPVHFDNDPNRMHKPFAEATAQQIDQEVQRIVEEAYRRCRDLLTEKKKEVGLLAEELLKKEVLVRDDMVRLLGKRPFDEEEFEKYFGGSQEKGAPPPPPTETESEPPPAPAAACRKVR
ncbi:hypothetical protein XA68_14254 [Ophiocordyceps unilateralis]|uniref:AAA+ ATPase domain-containing protein n=1 Tax=Ophiocordyceps unilateralis TaxID=268505 RepID=A0A2A9PAZ2_OPHUN|nr:hypothetical protein XA68_14254 [Ophiocordyceps unilateralis]